MQMLILVLLIVCLGFITTNVNAQLSAEDDSARFENAIKPIEDSVGMPYSLWQMVNEGKLNGLNADSLFNEFLTLYFRYIRKNAEYIKENPTSQSALNHFRDYILNRKRVSLDSLRLMFSYFSEDLRKSPDGLLIDSALIRKGNVSINSKAPVVSFLASDGKYYNTSSFEGKYLLITFWASWCSPCIKNIPMLKDLAKKFRGKLQMVSISLDNKESDWKAALGKYRMEWIQTCDISQYVSGTPIRKIFDVNLIPEYLLLDKEGKIIYQNFLVNDANYSVLRERLNILK